MKDNNQELEALACFYSSAMLARASTYFHQFRNMTDDNPVVRDSLFSSTCTAYAAALERFSRRGASFNPPARSATSYNKEINKLLLSFRNKLIAHRDQEVHKLKIITATAEYLDVDGLQKSKIFPLLSTTTTAYPINEGLIGAIGNHLFGVTDHMVEIAHEKFVRWRESVGHEMSPEAKSMRSTFKLEKSEDAESSILSVQIPQEVISSIPPVGADRIAHFVHLATQLIGSELNVNQPRLRTYYEIQEAPSVE